ncbi:hypothetical protein FBZ94_113119 [Bradyrhizobium sacchari]|uniref:Uncharacterized protein n=1 Tax=Bradyrhizobium sacchari TaxID=1399419 RepID=A0A560HWA7_9BRAD|nr:hypothetical protein FBZ94_113119 [Bradyrhizobium sacchari]TWB68214.1 hypothetical protein FBZ95_112119 [Bradyrhizobium sacchari]
MPTCSENLHGRTGRCAICDGRFGLVRYYAWRRPLCSKKCVERFATRRQDDSEWVGRFPIAFDTLSENRVRIP